jgi:hypothetical protein
MKIRKYAAILALILAQPVFAHGEDELGPHSGYIRMPGTYHVEVIPAKDELQIMLLDVNFKNPTVLNSSVKVRIKNGNNAYLLRCKSEDNYFSCPISANLLTNKSLLIVQSTRQFEHGAQVEYPLPFALPQKS